MRAYQPSELPDLRALQAAGRKGASVRPFLLYHWAPSVRRASILHRGLVTGKRPVTGTWKAPYLCFCRFPSTAWALSATHSGQAGDWDLWCCWSDRVEYRTLNAHGKAEWWKTECRVGHRIPKARLWLVGTRRFEPRRAAKEA